MTSSSQRRRVAVVGAGASGLVAGLFAAACGAETVILESASDGGRKLLVTGGGRCNILPARPDLARFVTDSSPNSLRKILRSWPHAEIVAFFEKELGLRLEEEAGTGKLFPVSQRAADVRDRLQRAAGRKGARLLANSRVTDLLEVNGAWRIERQGGAPIEADAVILATGGLSMPATGSDGAGFALARRLGHTVNETYPALMPLWGKTSPFSALAGITQEVEITARDAQRSCMARGALLFTHNGFSGPAVMDVAHVVARNAGARVTVRWTPHGEKEWQEMFAAKGGPRTVLNLLRQRMPVRLAEALCDLAGVARDQSLANLKRESRLRLVETLTRGELPVAGHGGYESAEVTGGGVALGEVDPRTLESRICPGLFFCGEILDAFGPIGGYNLWWAWVTGRAAGMGTAALG